MRVYSRDGLLLGETPFQGDADAILIVGTKNELRPPLRDDKQVRANHPIREEVALLAGYYQTIGGWMEKLTHTLNKWGLIPVQPDNFDPPEDGHQLIMFTNTSLEKANSVIFVSWYRMPTGRYEINCYISLLA